MLHNSNPDNILGLFHRDAYNVLHDFFSIDFQIGTLEEIQELVEDTPLHYTEI